MNKNLVIGIVVVVLLLAGGGYFLSQRTATAPEPTPSPSTTDQTMMTPPPSTSSSMSASDSAMMGAMKEFTVESKGLSFTPKEIKVKKGDMVKITYKNTMGTHDFVIDEFKVKTKLINSGQSETVEFTADKAGSFVYYCSVPGHRAAGMVGTLIVE